MAAYRHGYVPAHEYVTQARGVWRTGMRGLYVAAQHSITKTLADHADGINDLPTATRAAALDLIAQGVHTDALRDSAGRRWQPATYSEMLLRTHAQQAHQAVSINAANDTGTPYVVISNAHRECARCRPWETRVLRIDGVTDDVATATLDLARSEGLFHPNCRHQAYPWWREGDQLPNPKSTPDPQGYSASQKQRRLEREIRQARLLHETNRATIGPRAATTQATYAKLKAKRAELAAHVLEWEPRGTLKRNRWREVPRLGDIVLRAA